MTLHSETDTVVKRIPAVPDGHVTVVRLNDKEIDPYYLADYLRVGAGAIQVERLYTGSTGLIELQPEEVDQILVDKLSGVREQKKVSEALRKAEGSYRTKLEGAELELGNARAAFAKPSHLSVRQVK